MAQQISRTTVVGAGATTANVLVGEPLGFLPARVLSKLEASTSAAAGEMTLQFMSGLSVHAQNAVVNPAVAAGVLQGDGRDTILPGVVVLGQLGLTFTSTAVGATNATWRLTVDV